MSTTIHPRFVGVDLYCPDCRRLLCSVDDGSEELSLLAGQSEVSLLWDWDEIEEDDDGRVSALAVVHEATCLRPRCRLRRWARRKRDA